MPKAGLFLIEFAVAVLFFGFLAGVATGAFAKSMQIAQSNRVHTNMAIEIQSITALYNHVKGDLPNMQAYAASCDFLMEKTGETTYMLYYDADFAYTPNKNRAAYCVYLADTTAGLGLRQAKLEVYSLGGEGDREQLWETTLKRAVLEE